MKRSSIIAALVALGCVAPLSANAQVVREDGVKSIAGVLFSDASLGPIVAEWSFKSAGGEIVFASLDADIYRKPMGGHEEPHVTTAAADTGGGCSGEDGGPGMFKLSVVKAYGDLATLCEARRATPPPGWQRDPRIACVLPAMRSPSAYKVRVEFMGAEGETAAPSYPFLLNLSLRKVAPSGTNIQSAIATSSAGGF